jgi:diguanylate cyclase (GGDEF)-like protein
MTIENRERIRILIADDESEVLETYRKILIPPDRSSGADRFSELRARLYEDKAAGPVRHKPKTFKGNFDAEFCDGAEAAVEAVRKSLATGMPFAIAFLDMRMPPGPDGVWAAMRIRELDPAIEIVICTAYSDVDAGDIADLVQPEEKLSYVQKPFHPNEIRQMALSLASKWRAEHRIIKLAYFDTLTGLPNREQARNRLTSAIATAAARGKSLSVLYLDLDNFKRVNDTLGHGVGDELLRVAASRLLGSLRAGDMVCADGPARAGLPGHVFRLGGDEFIVLLANIDSPDEVSTVAARLIEDLQKPIQLGLHTVVVTPSVGIAVYPRDGQDVDTLMRHADLAMYVAKRGAPGRFEMFDARMNDTAALRFAVEAKLRGALERGEFCLHYQPQFDILAGGISGMEALLRWTNEELGSVPPSVFIPVAEESGLILEIGEWVLRTACQQAKTWRDQGLPAVRMAVNVSGLQFARNDFPSLVEAIIQTTGIEASMLELEITESVVMMDEAASERTFGRLKALGVSLAIDDFGTGYSNFGRLKQFSVNRLKIDRSFVTSLVKCNDDRAIASAIIAMSRSLRMSVTAEGVESFPQLAFLQEQTCQDAQGFFLSVPLTADDALKLLRRAANAAEAADTSRSARLRAIVL